MQTTNSCVDSLIEAFARGLDVVKKLRGRRRGKRKTGRARAQTALQDKSGDELRLSTSLRKGPVDIQNEYDRHYRAKGERFAAGDAIAQASLAKTLLKLDSGLVDIISSFLRCGRKDVQLDYQSLISLSDASRRDAVDALNDLSHRVSQTSFVSLHAPSRCSKCGQARHEGKCNTKDCSTEQLSHKRRSSKASQKAQVTPSTIRKVRLFNASAPQLAVVRPRPRNRRTQSSSSSSSSSQPSSPPSYHSSPPTSPPISTYAHLFPPQYQLPPYSGPSNPLEKTTGRAPPPIPRKPTKYRQEAAKLASSPDLPANSSPPPLYSSQEHPPLVRRRTDRVTPSMYTFASDSTKLGEIPMERWNVPFDFAAMERANREAALRPVPGVPVGIQGDAGGKGGGKRGFWSLFKKKNGGG